MKKQRPQENNASLHEWDFLDKNDWRMPKRKKTLPVKIAKSETKKNQNPCLRKL
jgi:hypothetical protein